MKLSHRVWSAIFALALPFQAARAGAQPVPLTSAMFSQEWADALERRIERLIPPLLNSLAAVRRQHDAELARCFDRAVAALNGVQRQVSYHAELRYEAENQAERVRHTRALALLSLRAEELGRSLETCFTDGVPVKPGETVVDVTVDRP